MGDGNGTQKGLSTPLRVHATWGHTFVCTCMLGGTDSMHIFTSWTGAPHSAHLVPAQVGPVSTTASGLSRVDIPSDPRQVTPFAASPTCIRFRNGISEFRPKS